MSAVEAHGSKRTILSLLLLGIVALCLSAFLTGGDEEKTSLLDLEHDAEIHRNLMEGLGDEVNAELAIPDWLLRNQDGTVQDLHAAMSQAISQTTPRPQPNLPPYGFEDIVKTSALYFSAYGTLVYDPESDDFFLLYSKRHTSDARTKLVTSFKTLAILLRKTFPERFQGPGSPELAIPMSSGDYPHLIPSCIKNFPRISDECTERNAIVLVFGSIFRNTEIFPNMIAMPMPESHHLKCFKGGVDGPVCSNLLPAGPKERGKMVFGEELGLEWENLIPQVVWRGTDFGYLKNALPRLRRPRQFDIQLVKWPWSEQSRRERRNKKIGGLTAKRYASLERVRERSSHNAKQIDEVMANFNKAAAVLAMMGQYTKLQPRWQAVVLTADADVEAASQPPGPDGTSPLPWANMKFSGYIHSGHKAPTVGAFLYKGWEDIGFATGESIYGPELAKYKYHIDLGGGGGTTWSGTIEKLAMPGLLFHHLTPTKDYIHDRMKPWIHYVPVAPDLRDLKEKYEWAESHQVAAKMIADQGTAMMRRIATVEGFGDMFQEVFTEPLRRVMEAYQPVSSTHPGSSWKEVLTSLDLDIYPIIRCSGNGEMEKLDSW